LDASQLLQLLRVTFGVQTWPESVLDTVMEIGRGNPLHTQMLCNSLILKKMIYLNTEKSICEDMKLKDEKSNMDGSIGRLILNRLEYLDSYTYYIMKIASVIGSGITPTLVHHVIPTKDLIRYPVSRIEEILASLCRERGFLVEVRRAKHHVNPNSISEKVFNFDLRTTKDVIYNMLPFSKKVVMHRKTAQALEIMHENDLERNADLIAFHYKVYILHWCFTYSFGM
jgi:predicted ATPase